MRILSIILYLTQIYSASYANTDRSPEITTSTVFEKNLVKKTTLPSEILDNFDKYVLNETARVENRVIGFVSNTEKSYKDATIFTKKITYVIPPWFSIKRIGQRQYEITGVENFDRKWIEDMMETRKDIRIVPRVTFKDWTARDFLMLATSDFEWISLGKELVHFCESFYFHGLTLDIFDQFSGKIPTDMLVNLTQELCVRLRMNYFEAILIVSPNFGQFNRHTFENLAQFASGFSLTPFEFPAGCHNPEPGVPMSDIEEFITEICPDERFRNIIYLGLNFHGFIYTNKSKRIIKKDEYLDLLQNYKHGVLEYDEVSSEHYFDITINGEKSRIVFPTLYTINQRIQSANKLGIGVGIWEMSDGLEYFYELL